MTSCISFILALTFVLPLCQQAKPDRRVASAVSLEIRLAEFEAGPGLVKAESSDPNRELYLHEEALVTNKDILEARLETDPVPEKPGKEMKVSDIPHYKESDLAFRIRLKFTQEARERIAMATGAHIGKPIAILIDGKVITCPIIRSSIYDEALIDPGADGFKRDQAQRIVNALNKK